MNNSWKCVVRADGPIQIPVCVYLIAVGIVLVQTRGYRSLVQSVRVLRLLVLELQQLHEALHVPSESEEGGIKGRLLHTSKNHKADLSWRRSTEKPFLPFLNEPDRGLTQQVVGQQVDFSHGVGQTHRQLLTQEHVGGFLTCILPPFRTWKTTGFYKDSII